MLIFIVYTIILLTMKIDKPRGRPQKSNSASETLSPIRVTPEQKALYKKAAEKAKLSVSSWIKELADRETQKKHN
ncbi:MAG: hypothetical protein SStaBPW_38140 [Shewanella algae]